MTINLEDDDLEMEEIKLEVKIENEEFGDEGNEVSDRNIKEENVIFKEEPLFLEDVAIKGEQGPSISFKGEEFYEWELLTDQKSKLMLAEEAINTARENSFLTDESCGKFSEYVNKFDNEVTLTEYAEKCHKICAHPLTKNDISVQNSSSICIDNNLKGPQCDVSDNKKNSGVNNIKSGHKERDVKRFKCKVCSYSFSRKDTLTYHIRAVHQKEKPFKCGECDYKCGAKSSLRIHVRVIHQKLKPYKCRFCNFCSGVKNKLKIHIQFVHQKLKLFKCSECKYTAGYKACLYKHIQAVHQKLRPFRCEDCDYSSFQKVNLVVHMSKIHTNKMPLKCKEGDCSSGMQEPKTALKLKPLNWNNRGFSKMGGRGTLELNAQSVCYSKFNSFKCSECDYTCYVKGSLSLHCKVAHPNSNL